MSQATHAYNPDYASAPGAFLEEELQARGWSQNTFAEKCGRSTKLISQIVSGDAPIEPQTALEFERVLGTTRAVVWLNMESAYRLFLAKQRENETLREKIAWAKNFPINDLIKLKIIDKPDGERSLVETLLRFLNMGSPEVWKNKSNELKPSVHFRQHNTTDLSLESLSAWIRMAEIKAAKQSCAPYNKSKFLQNLGLIRGLTRLDPDEFYPTMLKLCNDAGVALAIIPQLPKLPLSGIAKWLQPDKALIVLSLRYGTNDHFWFSFFHEAAHILHHSKKEIFIDSLKLQQDMPRDVEKEANDWAANILIPQNDYSEIRNSDLSIESIVDFSRKINIHPGIIVGRLQYDRLLPWSRGRQLKVLFRLNEND